MMSLPQCPTQTSAAVQAANQVCCLRISDLLHWWPLGSAAALLMTSSDPTDYTAGNMDLERLLVGNCIAKPLHTALRPTYANH